MEAKLNMAMIALIEKSVRVAINADEALNLTQAALNIAQVASIVDHIKRMAQEIKS